MFYSTDAMTSYRVADAPEGPWSAVEPDIWDNWAFYAAKTMFTGSRRFLIGWIATREDDTDLGPVQWGGHCAIPRELVPLPDGTLAQRCPPEIIDVYREEVALSVRGRTGRWRMVGETVEAARADGFAYASLGGQSDGLIEMSVKMRGPVCSAGVVFRASPDLSSYCALRVEPARRRVVIDRVPQIGEVNFRCERHLSVDEGEEVDVKLFLDGDMVEAFVGERRALGCRAYDFGDGEIGLYVEHGEAVFSNVRMRDVGG